MDLSRAWTWANVWANPARTIGMDDAVRDVGVGPWPADSPLPPGARFDADLLALGDSRNVADEFRYWAVEAISAELDAREQARPGMLQIAVENWGHDFNIGSVVRTANAFGVRDVHIVGRRRWNRRGAMVTDRYLHVHHHDDVDAFSQWAVAAGLPVVGIDNVPGSEPIERYSLPASCVLLFGEESAGLTMEARAATVALLHITQYGSTRSMNAGAAAAIAMFAWAQQHRE